jgi:signal transduction histidine kinase
LDVAGIEVDKTFYNTLVCGIIAGLIVVLVILGIRYKSSHAVARDAEKQLKTTEDELEELRRKSIEEQQRLGRQLQDERNKLARLKNQ